MPGAMSRPIPWNTFREDGPARVQLPHGAPTILDYSTWETMSTNGVWTGSLRIITRCHRRTIHQGRYPAHAVFLAAVPGGIRSKHRVPRIAAVCRRNFDIPITGFVWCAPTLIQ